MSERMEDREDGPLVTLFCENKAELAHGGLRLQPRIEEVSWTPLVGPRVVGFKV